MAGRRQSITPKGYSADAKKLGYSIYVSANGSEALEALECQRYDIVLMDVRMPEMNGLEATRIIRQRWPDDGPAINCHQRLRSARRSKDASFRGYERLSQKLVQLNNLANIIRKYLMPPKR